MDGEALRESPGPPAPPSDDGFDGEGVDKAALLKDFVSVWHEDADPPPEARRAGRGAPRSR